VTWPWADREDEVRVAQWRRFVRGRAELQAGGVLLLVGALGVVALMAWDSAAAPVTPGTVFTGRGFASAIVAIILVGVVALGLVLVVLGALVWLVQRWRGSD
jgi:hypothetical protein